MSCNLVTKELGRESVNSRAANTHGKELTIVYGIVRLFLSYLFRRAATIISTPAIPNYTCCIILIGLLSTIGFGRPLRLLAQPLATAHTMASGQLIYLPLVQSDIYPQIVFVSHRPDAGMFLMDPDGVDQTRVGPAMGSASSPAWSPVGGVYTPVSAVVTMLVLRGVTRMGNSTAGVNG